MIKKSIIKYLAYYNIIYSLLSIWTSHIKSSYNTDYLGYLFIGLTIWYSWETLKMFKGIRNNLTKINIGVGIAILLLSILFIVGSIGAFIINNELKSRNFFIGLILFMILVIPSFILVISTLKISFMNKNTHESSE